MGQINGSGVASDLKDIVAPAHTALLVIDMQNDFCSPGGASDRSEATLGMYPSVIRRIKAVITAAHKCGVRVMYVRMLALAGGESDSRAWSRLRMRAAREPTRSRGEWPLTVAGSWGADFVPSLEPTATDLVITKYRSSAFYGTELDLFLRCSGVTTVVVTGCTTEGCVESTVRDAGMRDYFTVLLSDCVASDDVDLHEASLRVMTAYRTDVTTSDRLAAEWMGGGAKSATPRMATADERGESH
jgi:nicotinamidase-related amidase